MDNILSEETAKKIHEAGNCELHEVQRRTDKVQCQRCYSYVEAGFQVCPCGGRLNMSEEMLSCIKQIFKELIANAYTPFQKRRGAKHGAQLWQKNHFEAKDASQRQHNWTEEWCKYLDLLEDN